MSLFRKQYKLPDPVTSNVQSVHASIVDLAPGHMHTALDSKVGWFLVGGAVSLTSYFVIRRILKFFLA
ncbi:MAG: hypothetical protein Hyperionvirus24_16 [Hyperionvirus sp.]|uniref:Uncharacterized protein n=1 Tax=Hyperionvirus sp. TaxID=2487770 RepID=A0A3G5ACR5_9VIRU|nr:MAG: hypothetical protein Hyperionvirus24_16 [Hyperionvirus sp.]